MQRDEEHERSTAAAIRRAIGSVPFYAKQGLTLPDDGASLADVLAKAPLLTRDKIRTTLPKMWLPEGRDAKSELASGKLAVVETGTAESRWRFLFDASWWRDQERRALAANAHAASALAGEMGPYKEAVLWTPERGTGSCGSGDPEYDDRLEGIRVHLNSRQDPTFWSDAVMTRMLDELGLHGTVGLLADPFYLDVLARHAAVLGRRIDARGFVALTRALTTAAHRAAIARVYPGTIFQVYGARATGVLFVEGDDGLLQHVPGITHVELLPCTRETPGAKDVALVVVTTLTRDVQPFVRFVTGDLVQVADGAPRFTTVKPIASVEGKLEDAILRPDGAIVTPGAIDRALAPLGLRAYQVMQRAPAELELEVVGGSAEAARDALAALCGGMKIEARPSTSLAVEPDGKYKTSHRRLPLPAADAFQGAS